MDDIDLDEAEKHKLVAAWIAHHHAERPTRSAHFWAWEAVNDLVKTSPDTCWALVHAIRAADGSDKILSNLAAGPVEDLLVYHGHRYIDDVERLSRTDPQFRKLLGGVWKNDIADDVWARILRIAGPRF
jgi:hypothetical protein